MDTIVQDLRYGMRQLLKNPGFTAVAVVTLALGIGINATMFSLVSAILLRRPPGHEPDRVAVVTGIDPGNGYQPDTAPVSIPNYLAWREGNHVFSEMAAADEYHTASLTGRQESEPFVVPPKSGNSSREDPAEGRGAGSRARGRGTRRGHRASAPCPRNGRG